MPRELGRFLAHASASRRCGYLGDACVGVPGSANYGALRGLKLVGTPGVRYQYLAFNLERPYLSDVRVRQAIAYAVDRDSIIRYLYRGFAQKASSLLPPFHWAYEPDVRQYPYDPARARQLLDQAGYKPRSVSDPTRFSLNYSASTSADVSVVGA